MKHKTMTTSDTIKHQGKIERIEAHKVFVRIEQKPSCQECHAGSVCFASDKKAKIIEVNDFSGSFTVQEEVVVSVRQSLGLFAVVLAYVLPLVFVILSVVAGQYLTGSEVIGGLTGLLVLLPYYYVLYLLRSKLKKKFIFSLSKNTGLINPDNCN